MVDNMGWWLCIKIKIRVELISFNMITLGVIKANVINLIIVTLLLFKETRSLIWREAFQFSCLFFLSFFIYFICAFNITSSFVKPVIIETIALVKTFFLSLVEVALGELFSKRCGKNIFILLMMEAQLKKWHQRRILWLCYNIMQVIAICDVE